MKKTISAMLIAAAVCVPFVSSADAADDAILEMLRALEGTKPAAAPVATTSASTSAATVKTPPKEFTTAVPKPVDQVLAPGHLFSLDGNVPPADPQVEQLKAALATLTAKYLNVATGLAVQASTTATSTPATSTTAAKPPKPTFTRDLTLGSRGEEVRTLQTFLIARGLLFGDVTGYFGILTKTAVIAFQTENGLPAVGNVGPRTRAVLNAMPVAPGQATSELIIGPPARPLIATSTSMSATSTATSTADTASSTPLFDAFYPPPSVSMSVLPSEADVGGSVAVTWLSQNATGCVASDGWDGPKATLGAARIEPLQFTLNLVLTCTGPGGIASTTALVVVGGEQ